MNDIQTNFVKNAYDTISTEFKATRAFTWSWTDEFILNLQHNSIILDIGCGTGRNLNYSNVNIIGVDISFEQLRHCTKNTIQTIMSILPFKNNTFDFILSIASFHHLNKIDDRIKCLEEMSRVLVSGGKILLSVWSINQPAKTKRKFTKYGDTFVYWRDIPRYYYIFEISEIKNLICKYFTIEKHFWDCGNEIFILRN